jgi:hypothetical protein
MGGGRGYDDGGDARLDLLPRRRRGGGEGEDARRVCLRTRRCLAVALGAHALVGGGAEEAAPVGAQGGGVRALPLLRLRLHGGSPDSSRGTRRDSGAGSGLVGYVGVVRARFMGWWRRSRLPSSDSAGFPAAGVQATGMWTNQPNMEMGWPPGIPCPLRIRVHIYLRHQHDLVRLTTPALKSKSAVLRRWFSLSSCLFVLFFKFFKKLADG